MYVVLPVSWFKHPFITNEFVIKTQDQIAKIIDYGIRDIKIDISKGLSPRVGAPEISAIETRASTPPKTWTPEMLVPAELREALHDKALSPEKNRRS